MTPPTVTAQTPRRSADGVSVVIPTRNRPHLLGATLVSVLRQRDVDLEVIVVDDASDEPIDGVDGLDERRVVHVQQPEQRGVAAARNAGLARATKPWVAFTDDDDLWAPDKLARQLAALAAAPEARWSCVGAVNVDDDLRLIRHGRPPRPGDVSRALLHSNCIPGGASGVLASTALVREIGGFTETLSNSADYDLWIRLALASPLASVDAPLLAYRVHANALSRQLDAIDEELVAMRATYASERARLGIELGESIQVWIGDRHQRSGRRLPAFRAYLRAAPTTGPLLAAARATEALLWPPAYRWRDERRRRLIPPDWSAEVETWVRHLGGRAVPRTPVTTRPSSLGTAAG